MSWISILMILICAITAINGYRRGFTKTVVSMISFLVIVLLVSILNPLIANIVDTYTDVGVKIEEQCMEMLGVEADEDWGRNEQITLIEELPIPEKLQADLIENNNSVIYEILGVHNFLGYIASYLAKIILRAVVFLLSALLAWVIVKIVGLCLNGASRMPVIGFFNKMGGFVLGLASGLIFIWILFLIVTIFSGTGWAASFLQVLEQDSLANYIYQKNPFVWLLIVFLVM